MAACSSPINVINPGTKQVQQNPEDESILIEANKFKLLGNYDRALELYQALLLKNPNSAVAAYSIGTIYFSQGFYSKAYDFALKAVKLNPDNSYYSLFYIDCCFQAQHSDQAFLTYEKLLTMQPSNYDLFMEYANLLFQTKRYEESLKIIHEFESINGSNEEILLFKNHNFFLLHQLDSVESVLGQLIILKPNSVQYNGLLAEFYLSKNEYTKADSIYNFLISSGNANGNVYLSKANFERIRKDSAKVLEYFFIAISDKSLSF
ncbi:MAG: tetratricopeptide repeat protein, partial [Bacteroidales bacterium]|nr:tetratricopeptide repeat protein [Bacteroidales bacterium]